MVYEVYEWPEGFLWGTAASSTQCEGAAPASDWRAWEELGRAPHSGDGNGFTRRYGDDFRILAGLGLTHHRLSLEWARLEPEEHVHDSAAIAHYRAVLEAARDVGIAPWVCLHHFTLPRWFADAGGYLVDANRTGPWSRHVEFVAETFGDLVGGWQPVNETNYYARAAYGGGGWPPGHDDRGERALAEEGIQLATAEAARRLRQTGAPVVSIFGLSPIVVQDDGGSSSETAQKILDALWSPGLGLFKDGVLRVRGREPIDRPDLAEAFDLIGFSYYAAMGVRDGRVMTHPPDAPTSPLGYAIWPEGVGLVLEELHRHVPGTGLVVAELGVGTDDDRVRVDYLERALASIHQATERGVDVRGVFHWTAVDNYEWLHGYDVAFGIIDRERRVRESAHVLARQAASSPLPPSLH